jgi:hypothetical protein
MPAFTTSGTQLIAAPMPVASSAIEATSRPAWKPSHERRSIDEIASKKDPPVSTGEVPQLSQPKLDESLKEP